MNKNNKNQLKKLFKKIVEGKYCKKKRKWLGKNDKKLVDTIN